MFPTWTMVFVKTQPARAGEQPARAAGTGFERLQRILSPHRSGPVTLPLLCGTQALVSLLLCCTPCPGAMLVMLQLSHDLFRRWCGAANKQSFGCIQSMLGGMRSGHP